MITTDTHSKHFEDKELGLRCSQNHHCPVCDRDHEFAYKCMCGHDFGDHGHKSNTCPLCNCVQFDHME